MTLWLCAWMACSANEQAVGETDRADEPDVTTSTRPTFCERMGADAIRDAFCLGDPPVIRSLSELQALLHIQVDPLSHDSPPPSVDGYTVNKAVVVLGHSTALSGHLVSPINPRAIVMGGSRTIMAYQRGVQRVELATLTYGTPTFNFYLFSFDQACTAAVGGCVPGDLYTPKVERNWTRTEIRDDEALANTQFDCRQCHQRGTDTPTLLMRELQSPWTHFFEQLSEGETLSGGAPLPGVRGADLLRDYLQARGDEAYGGISQDTIAHTSAFLLEGIVETLQPLLFDAPTIETERFPFAPDGHRETLPQPSPTWNTAYEAFKRGEQLALPYVEPRVTDPDKSARLTDAYARYRAGELDARDLPDMADIFPDDPMQRAQIGLQTEPGATAADALIQACGSCHNDVLDQSISRARFNIDLTKLDRDELEAAAERVERPQSRAGAMPPSEARQLDAEGRVSLIALLRGGERRSEDEVKLQRAAAMGMARRLN